MKITNWLLDIGIFAAFLIATEPNLTGEPVHEWLSLALAGTIVVHLLLHWKWIVTVGKTYFAKLFQTSRLKFFVDVLLFLAFNLLMLSGLMISKTILPAFGITRYGGGSWRMLHPLASNVSVILLGVHVGLNWKWVACTFKRFVITPVANLFRRPKAQPVTVSIKIEE